MSSENPVQNARNASEVPQTPATASGAVRRAVEGLWGLARLTPLVIAGFLIEWGWTRRWRKLLYALPALAAAAGAVVTAELAARSGSELSPRYQAAATRALAEDRFSAAEIYFRKVLALDPSHEEARFGLALTTAGRGHPERAAEMMARLAPRDRAGYWRAHLWQARRLLHESGDDSQRREAARAHLVRAVRSNPGATEAHVLLARMYLASGELERAKSHLRQGAEVQPELRLTLASVHRKQGAEQLARLQADRMRAIFQKHLRSEPKSVRSRVHLAQARLFLGDYSEAIAVLREGQALEPDRPYHRAISSAYVAWAEAIAEPASGGKQSAETLRKRLQLLSQALSYAPKNTRALAGLLELAGDGRAVRQAARDQLHDALARGTTPALTHFILAELARLDGKEAVAQDHLEQAYRQAPKMGIIANNLAWVLAHADPPQLERALAIIDSAVERWPKNPQYRDTRGAILARMGRWKAALADFEAALPALSGNSRLHRNLAEVYANLQMKQLAAKHRKLAESEAQ